MPVTLDDIKRLVIVALVSDDRLLETLVLKGGNAIDLIQREHTSGLSRSSYDLDYSMEGDADQELSVFAERIERTLVNTFQEEGLVIFDYRFTPRPSVISDEIKDFWGGYHIGAKITTQAYYDQANGNIEKLRRTAIAILPNGSPKIEIEISKYEYVGAKMEKQVDGLMVYVYSPEMIVFEKLRAICQQLPGYAAVIPSHSPRPRARDFYDIHLIMEQYRIDPSSASNRQLITQIFAAKKVPLSFIGQIDRHLSIHRQDWQNVLDTLSVKEEVKAFDFYVDFVCGHFKPLAF